MLRRQSKKIEAASAAQECLEASSLDLVREMLQSRNPQLLEAFEDSIAEMSNEG